MSTEISKFFSCLYIVLIICFKCNGDHCPYSEWSSHKLIIYETYNYSLINASTSGLYLNESKYGVEGGQIILLNSTFYLFITEFTGDPLFVPSNLALWTANIDEFPFKFVRLKTLFKSGGIVDCNYTNYRASLGSSISVFYNNTLSKWMLFYVGFISCNNDSYFVNRNGRIFQSESTISGLNGIIGPFQDIDIILKPDNNSEIEWEGLQGIDSFSNPFQIVNGSYFAFYGSAQTQNNPCCNQRVGLCYHDHDPDPDQMQWIRSPYPQINPVSLTNPNNHTEQPIIIKYDDDTFGAVFNTLNTQSLGDIGYSWSKDGINWNPNCMQMLNVNPQNGPNKGWGKARTPQGLIPINKTHFYLFFSGHDVGNNHESFGMVKVKFNSSNSTQTYK